MLLLTLLLLLLLLQLQQPHLLQTKIEIETEMSLPEVFQFSVHTPPSLLSDSITEPEESTYQEELLSTPLLIEDTMFKLDLEEPLIEQHETCLVDWSPQEDMGSEFANAAQTNYRLWLGQAV